MALEHATLTGAQLHEPKGVETALAGQVYVADGLGSGTWVNPLLGIYNANKYVMDKRMDDLATASSVYFNIPFNSEFTGLNVITYGAVDADTILSIYINGVLFAQSLTVIAAGSGAGVKQSLAVTTNNSIPAGSIVRVDTNGAATAAVRGDLQLAFRATV